MGLPAFPCPQGPANWKTQIYLRTYLGYLCWETRLHIGKFQQPKMAFLKGASLITQLQKGFLPSLKPQLSCGGGSCEAFARNHVHMLQRIQLSVSLLSSRSHSICSEKAFVKMNTHQASLPRLPRPFLHLPNVSTRSRRGWEYNAQQPDSSQVSSLVGSTQTSGNMLQWFLGTLSRPSHMVSVSKIVYLKKYLLSLIIPQKASHWNQKSFKSEDF